MQQTTIAAFELSAREAAYKRCSGAAIAATHAIVRFSQMARDEAQRPLDPGHVDKLRISMEDDGVHKGHALHGYIDVEDPAWKNRSQLEGVALIEQIESLNKLMGDGKATVGVLPKDIPVRISNGNHRLHAYCRYMVNHWDDINNVRPPLNPPPINRLFAESFGKTAADILAQDDAWWLVNLEYIPNPRDPRAKQARCQFLVDVNQVDTTKANSTIRNMSLSALGSKCITERTYKWLSENCAVPPLIQRLSRYTFLHSDDVIIPRRIEDMSYRKQRSLCILAISETVAHLDHISSILAIPPEMFEAHQMWKQTPPNPSAIMKKEDLNVFFTTRMNSIGDDVWTKTLERPYGYSQFTGKRNWADGSNYWTLATTFDKKGWLFPKLELAVALIYWTIHFLLDQDIEGREPGKKGVDYYLMLRELLAMENRTKKLRNTILAAIWSCATEALENGVNPKKLKSFSTGQSRNHRAAISIYFRAITNSPTPPEADFEFAKYLERLVDKETGVVGRYCGWSMGSFMDVNAAKFNTKGNRRKLDESDGEESEESESEGNESKGDEDEDEQQLTPHPPPTKALVKPVANLKRKEKATPSAALKAKHPLRGEGTSYNTRRKQKQLSEVDEMELNSQPQPPPSEETDAVIKEGGVPFWDSFMDVVAQNRGKLYQSPQEWLDDLNNQARKHAKMQ